MRHHPTLRVLATLGLVCALPAAALAQTQPAKQTTPTTQTAQAQGQGAQSKTNGTALGSAPGQPATSTVSGERPVRLTPRVSGDAGKIVLPFGTGQKTAFQGGQPFDWAPRPQDEGRW